MGSLCLRSVNTVPLHLKQHSTDFRCEIPHDGLLILRTTFASWFAEWKTYKTGSRTSAIFDIYLFPNGSFVHSRMPSKNAAIAMVNHEFYFNQFFQYSWTRGIAKWLHHNWPYAVLFTSFELDSYAYQNFNTPSSLFYL